MVEDRFPLLLTEKDKKAVYLGDGAYAIVDEGTVEIFASNGVNKSYSVFLDEYAVERLYKMLF
jgi:hypothetical protein